MTSNPKLIVIGGSAGSLQGVLKILAYIKEGFPVPVLLVLHRNVQFDSSLEELLSARTGLIAKEIDEKDRIEPGYVYISPADYHVLIENDHSFSLDESEKVNFSRPSIDVVFSSAAAVYKNSLVAILLSGANADGTEGLIAVKEKGGMVVIQDTDEAIVPFMPQFALRHVKADHVLTVSEIAGLLNSFAL